MTPRQALALSEPINTGSGHSRNIGAGRGRREGWVTVVAVERFTQGRPMWMAMASYRDFRGKVVPVKIWHIKVRAKAESFIVTLLDGVGRPGTDRVVEGRVNLSLRRGLTTQESKQFKAR